MRVSVYIKQELPCRVGTNQVRGIVLKEPFENTEILGFFRSFKAINGTRIDYRQKWKSVSISNRMSGRVGTRQFRRLGIKEFCENTEILRMLRSFATVKRPSGRILD
jgi:hypothetical protein